MRQAGVEVRGVALDTMIAAFVLDSSRMQYGIDRLALDYLNIRKVPTSDLIGKGAKQISMQKVDLGSHRRLRRRGRGRRPSPGGSARKPACRDSGVAKAVR